MKNSNQNLFSFIEYVELLLKNKNDIVYFFAFNHTLKEELSVCSSKKEEKKLKDAFYKTFIRYNEKLNSEYSLLVEEVIITHEELEEHLLRQEIDNYRQFVRGEEKGVRIGYKLKTDQAYLSTVQELFNLKAIISQTKEKSRLLKDPQLYLENIDFEKGNQRINQNNWLEWFDDVMLCIGRLEFIEIEYQFFEEERREKVLPMKVRENLYGKLYLMSIRVNQNNDLPFNVGYENISIIEVEGIKSITKRKEFFNTESKQNQQKIKQLKEEFQHAIQSFVGVIVPDFPYRYTPDAAFMKDNIPTIRLKVSSFQLPFLQNLKSRVNVRKDREDGYHIVEFKTVPTFEFIRYVVMLSDVWNCNIERNGKKLDEETAIEVLSDGGTTTAWIRDYLKETYRRALLKYEDNPEIKRELKQEIKSWEPKVYPFLFNNVDNS
ncbi:hypothetical protein [Flammeovirga sp. SJP92]|uniref:hypothetical protein n=1 Tax=Flammeovirga sp. SJP92 TaxID=1775430 RepID=UPI00078783CA|nr:hypothetical protein [Flammeovirga sp. SJP92]KXX71420.1 hypothetical protein AVL50_05825 [Flammeovirga sp. SJP92]